MTELDSAVKAAIEQLESIPEVGFILLVIPLDVPETMCSVLSNIDHSDSIELMKNMIANMEAIQPKSNLQH